MRFRLLGEEIHYRVYLFLLITIAIALPISKAILSIAMVLLVINFLIDGGIIKLKRIVQNRLTIIISLFFLIHFLGLIWSIDVNEGLKDIKSKLPLLIFPVIVYCYPLRKLNHWQWILSAFIISLFASSVINMLSYYQVLGERPYDDIRGMSLFASHIRYALMIGLGAGVSLFLFLKEDNRLRIIYFLFLVWFCIYTYFSEVLSGAIALATVFASFIFYFLFYFKKYASFVFVAIIFSALAWLIYSILPIDKKELKMAELEWYSPYGNPYIHHPLTYSEITGEPVIYYYCEEELKPAWENASSYPFNGNTDRGISIKFTLARYMAAKSLRKDRDGFKSLSKEDISNIEKGYFSYEESQGGLLNRIYSVRHQILNNENPNGHSLLQRIEYWKASLVAIKKANLIGYGTGSNQKILNKIYEETNSPLNQENRHCSHNQYLSYMISHGIIGFILFIYLLFTVLKDSLLRKNLIGFLAILTLITSFMFEDTLETQVGVSIFGLFIALSLAYDALMRVESESNL